MFAVGHPSLSREGEWLAGVLACGEAAVLSHRSAAELWGFWRRHWPRVDVTTTTNRRPRRGIDLHRTRRPPEATAKRGIPTTTPARTLTDLAEVTTDTDFRRALREARTLSLIAHDWEPDQINGRRRAATTRAKPGRTKSDLELLFLNLCQDHGINPPEVNAWIHGLEVDFLWRDHNLVVEVDSWKYHRGPEAFERDRERDRTLVAAGLRVLRFTDRQLEGDRKSVADTVRLASRP